MRRALLLSACLLLTSATAAVAQRAGAAPANADVVGKWEFTVNAGHMTRYHILRREPLRTELESFIECMKSGERPVVDGTDGLRALELAATIMNLKKSESVVLRWRENP